MNTIMKAPQESAESHYAMLRVALEMYGKAPGSLAAEEYRSVLQQANRELAIGQRVLQAREAVEVVIPDAVVIEAITALKKRFDSEAAFLQALDANGLDRNTLHQALQYELRVEAVLEKVMAEKAAISDADVEIYYLQHLEKFELPETRTARHILITINDDYEENRRERALARLVELRSQLVEQRAEFSSLAQRHSECPSALQEGLLGRIKPGQLFPELDAALFDMGEGEISDIIESPAGLHLLLCEQIHVSLRRGFNEVKEKLRAHLENRRRKRLLKDWLQTLR